MNAWERVNVASLALGVAFLLILAGFLMARSQPAPQPLTAPPAAAAASPQVLPEVLTFRPAVAVAEAREWAEATLAGSGVELPASASLIFSDVANCGADISADAMGGCTYQLVDRVAIVISPDLAWTQAGAHILFHEVAHALGIANECAAEEWAHQFEDEPYWSYPTCNA